MYIPRESNVDTPFKPVPGQLPRQLPDGPLTLVPAKKPAKTPLSAAVVNNLMRLWR